MQQLTPGDLETLGGATIVISILVEIILRAAPAAFDVTRYGPLVALVVGVVLVGGVAALTGVDVISGIITGILAAASAMGLQNVVTQSVLATQNPAPPNS